MKPTINLSREGNMIQIFIPAQLGRHSGRKTILSPTGQPENSNRNEGADVTLLNAFFRACRWSRWLKEGKVDTVKESAKHEVITSPSYASRILRQIASRILRLKLLDPDIQEMILNSTHQTNLTLADFMGSFPQFWELQRKQFGFDTDKSTPQQAL